MMVVRSDDGAEFNEEEFGTLCQQNCINKNSNCLYPRVQRSSRAGVGHDRVRGGTRRQSCSQVAVPLMDYCYGQKP